MHDVVSLDDCDVTVRWAVSADPERYRALVRLIFGADESSKGEGPTLVASAPMSEYIPSGEERSSGARRSL
jgi:hypothetical protein